MNSHQKNKTLDELVGELFLTEDPTNVIDVEMKSPIHIESQVLATGDFKSDLQDIGATFFNPSTTKPMQLSQHEYDYINMLENEKEGETYQKSLKNQMVTEQNQLLDAFSIDGLEKEEYYPEREPKQESVLESCEEVIRGDNDILKNNFTYNFQRASGGKCKVIKKLLDNGETVYRFVDINMEKRIVEHLWFKESEYIGKTTYDIKTGQQI
ncbi:uncharacterized protein LOC119684059 [Teleopsis dalmanni]|uniref:uncharacterized protein LOC119684059 n=1 Tax=Teleopsis dalmanni TaxID=139649 RepID=UPI000D32ACFD|nr:uncharacterized protein LOC119684059 [Teleopsis dalmanni]